MLFGNTLVPRYNRRHAKKRSVNFASVSDCLKIKLRLILQGEIMKYALRSKENGKYLTHLFEDRHNKMFTAKEYKPPMMSGGCYYYTEKGVAENVAALLNAEVVEIND